MIKIHGVSHGFGEDSVNPTVKPSFDTMSCVDSHFFPSGKLMARIEEVLTGQELNKIDF